MEQNPSWKEKLPKIAGFLAALGTAALGLSQLTEVISQNPNPYDSLENTRFAVSSVLSPEMFFGLIETVLASIGTGVLSFIGADVILNGVREGDE